jgi:hypothetical protein
MKPDVERVAGIEERNKISIHVPIVSAEIRSTDELVIGMDLREAIDPPVPVRGQIRHPVPEHWTMPTNRPNSHSYSAQRRTL